MVDQRLYPYALTPLERPMIWGGRQLVERFGKQAEPDASIGESWECWDANLVANGALAGESLAGLRATLGSALMGPLCADAPFPVLTKFIDARDALSVQVHPDDAYAQRVEHEANGKTECWHILHAEPGAELVLGWTRTTDREEYARRVADGSLGELLRRVPVEAGQTYFLPAGTLHAIGAGIVLFEAQQTSDLTYRIFDWNRVGSDGKPRALHIDKAADVLDFGASSRGATGTLTLPAVDGVERALLVADCRFALERVRVAAGASLPTGARPLTLTALHTPLELHAAATTPCRLAPWATAVIPAASEAVMMANAGEALVVRPFPDLDDLRRTASAGAPSDAVASFFGQFA